MLLWGHTTLLYFDAIYISDSKEIELFENENIKKTLSQIYEEMNNSKALSKHYNGRPFWFKCTNSKGDLKKFINNFSKKKKILM